jgi:hypothetical protein
MSGHLLAVGANNPELDARTHDFYQTPRRAIEALLSVEKFDGLMWECACGAGAISSVLEEHGYTVVSSDLIDRGFGVGGVDFLKQEYVAAPNIVTNPPFNRSLEFVLHARRLATVKTAILCRTLWLESSVRYSKLFEADRPARMWQFSKRLPMMHREGWTGVKSTPAIAYAWYVWDRGNAVQTVVDWLP